jgi:aerobic-type carbon monoxide dehydrogenase small subunit (CoxS/CutS family)
MKVALIINRKLHELTVAPGETLLDALRRAGFTGVKRGCEEGTCGSCVVLVDGVPSYSCMLLAAGQDGRQITTIEGLGSVERPHPIAQAFAEEAGVQCGYCVPAMVLSTKALLDERPDPTEQEIRAALDGHLCRCTGYVKQIRAVQRAAAMVREQKERG